MWNPLTENQKSETYARLNILVYRSTFPSQSFARCQWQFCAQLQETKKDVCGKAASPCPTMNAHLGFVSHMFCPDTRLCHGSSTSGHRDPSSTLQQVLRKPPNLGFDQLRIVKLQIYVLHTPFQFVDKDSPPSYAGTDHWQPNDNAMVSSQNQPKTHQSRKITKLSWNKDRMKQWEINCSSHTW